MLGSKRRALMSFMIAAPWAIAACATADFVVSTEIIASLLRDICSTTGMTRANSSSTLTERAPGRLDSPPMSMMSAPSSIIFSARSTASCAVM